MIQQRAGVSLPGGVGSSGDSYERNADAVADTVVQGRSAESLRARSEASTLAVTRRETNGWKTPLWMTAYLFALAYAACFVVYRLASLWLT